MPAPLWMRRMALAAPIVLASACGGGGESDGGGGDATAVVQELAAQAATEFEQRGEGTFFDTGYLSYCRAGSGFGEGVFAALGYSDETAPDGYELCYNVSGDRKKVAVGATSTSSGDTTCIVLVVTDGSVTLGPPQEAVRCTPDTP